MEYNKQMINMKFLDKIKIKLKKKKKFLKKILIKFKMSPKIIK